LALKQEKTIAKSIFLKPASHNIGRLWQNFVLASGKLLEPVYLAFASCRCYRKVCSAIISMPKVADLRESTTPALFLLYPSHCLWTPERATHSTNRKRGMQMARVWIKFWLVEEFWKAASRN
jgi:hypothetical protein